ncbi:MAG: hypothetical protein EBR82_51105 [Caulobacteraceae bacterium]|nr:hypothetical protein [Caulobacteraceae bacterium]
MKKKKINLTREKANRLLQDLVVQSIETLHLPKERMPYYTTSMAVFGSYMDNNKHRLGDLDIFVETKCKWPDEREMQIYFENHPDNKGRTILQRAAYPREIFYRFLKNGSTAITLHDMGDRQLMHESNPDFKSQTFCTTDEMILEIKDRLKCLLDSMETCHPCILSDLSMRRKDLYQALSFINLERTRQICEMEKKREMKMLQDVREMWEKERMQKV